MVCEADGCWVEFDQPDRILNGGGGRAKRFCSHRCRNRTHRRANATPRPERPAPVERGEPELPPFWKAYLRRFDRAILERTPEAWAAYRCAAIPRRGPRNKPFDPDLADLLRSLEVW